VVPSFGNPFFRFYSPSIDSPMIPDCNDLSFAGRSPNSLWAEELQKELRKKLNGEASNGISAQIKKDFSFELEDDIISEALQKVQRRQQLPVFSDDEDEKMDFPLDNYESSPWAEQILSYLKPFFKQLKDAGIISQSSELRTDILGDIVERLLQYSSGNYDQTQELKRAMNVKQLIVPYLELDLPPALVLKYNELDEDDPVVTMYQYNPVIAEKVRELEVLLDRYDTTKEVLCILVWSTHSNSLVCLPSVGLVPYPLCRTCRKSFGMHACAKCGVAKYCSKDCQQVDWNQAHMIQCAEVSTFVEKHKLLVLE